MSLLLTTIVDGPLSGGLPKAIEIYVTADIADLSQYGIGSANNGGGSDGEEFTFPAVSATAGDYIYIASEIPGFNAFFGFDPDYTSFAASINGDDAIEVFHNGVVIDTFGDISADGTGTAWDYQDGWASRIPGTTATGAFALADWTFSSPNALDNEATNAGAATPAPLASYGGGTPPAPTFTINEIDADQSGTDAAEFIELYDGGLGNSSLDGLSVVLFNGNGDAEYDTISLDGFTTDANGFFVIGSANVPNVDLTAFTTNGLQNGADAVALYSGTPPTAATTTNLIDAIVYGTNDADDVGLLAALGQSVQYNEGNNADALARDPDGTGTFVAQAPTPGATNFVPPPTVITRIHEIQGAVATTNFAQIGVDDVSPLNGQTVTIQAVVTADFQDGLFGSLGDLNGFYVQEEITDYDMNDLTSEGIFIFDGSAPAVDVAYGDIVQITGTVGENFGQTQISATDVQVLGNDVSLVPSAVNVTFPTATVMDDGSGGLVANLEAYEGMLVNIAQDMTITEMFNLDRFGQYTVNANGQQFQFTQNNAPDQAGYAAHVENVAASTIVLDDGSTRQNPDPIRIIDGNDGILTAADSFRMGDQISNITGVVNYSFGEFRIQNGTGDYAQTNPRPDQITDVGGNFKIASLNVLNYFTTLDLPGVTTDIGANPRGADNQAEFDRQADKIVNAIVAMDADILGLVELENDFAGANFAIKDLVDKVNAKLGSDVYAWIDPGVEFVGNDAIANGIIYKHAEVQPLGSAAILTTHNGQNFLDPLGAGRDLNRAAIAQTFEDLGTGQTMTVSVNHFKSKGSLSGLPEDNDQLDGQGNNNATRTEASKILADWLASDPTGQGSPNTLILGDLNAYAMEDPVTALLNAGYTDLAAATLGNSAYSFTFDGQVGTLDYILASGPMVQNLTGVTEWHINADEADAIDYNLDFGRNPSLFDPTSAARNSDHDPVVAGFNLPINYNLIAGTDNPDWLDGTSGRDRIEGMDGNDHINGFEGDDLIIAGSGPVDFLNGGAGADIFQFSENIALDGHMDKAFLLDFDVTEDMIDLGGAIISQVREKAHWVEIQLDGGQDKIIVYNTNDFDEIMFTDSLSFV